MRYRRPLYSPVQITMAETPRMQKIRIAVTCPQCEGACGYYAQLPGRPETRRLFECEACKGHGEVEEWERRDLDALVRKEIADLQSKGLCHTDNLVTHLIEIGDLEDGPLIEVHGHADKLYAEFVAKPHWVTHAASSAS